MKVATEPVMSEVVRQRLELLLAEVRPRYAIEDERPADEAGMPEAEELPPGVGHVGEEAEQVSAPQPARLLRSPPGALVRQLGRRARDFTRDHLAAVLLVLVVGCGWTAYSLLQARSTPVAVAAASPVVVDDPTATPTPSAPPRILVHVIGAVRHPGLVDVASGSRVADAVAAAGGLASTADPAELNLAEVVDDGSQVVIGTRAKPRGEVRAPGSAAGPGAAVGTASPAGAATVSLNTATLSQLDTLPGVGPVTAQKILEWRAQHGRFSSVSELQEVDGIGPKTFADIAPHVRV